jgi:hypothetical protein
MYRSILVTVEHDDMAISEHDRYELYRWFEDTAGSKVADTMMAHLPPTGWGDVATKRDLDHLAERMRGEMHRELRLHLMVFVGFNISLFGAATALFR